MNQYEIRTMLKGHNVTIPCTSEQMARDLLKLFAKVEPQGTCCYDNVNKLSIVAWFDEETKENEREYEGIEGAI
jgi:hypothetical protein